MTVIKDSQLSSNSDIATTIGEFNFLVSETATEKFCNIHRKTPVPEPHF